MKVVPFSWQAAFSLRFERIYSRYAKDLYLTLRIFSRGRNYIGCHATHRFLLFLYHAMGKWFLPRKCLKRQTIASISS